MNFVTNSNNNLVCLNNLMSVSFLIPLLRFELHLARCIINPFKVQYLFFQGAVKVINTFKESIFLSIILYLLR